MPIVRHIYYEKYITFPWAHSWPSLFTAPGAAFPLGRSASAGTYAQNLIVKVECLGELVIEPVAYFAGHPAANAIRRRPVSTVLIPVQYESPLITVPPNVRPYVQQDAPPQRAIRTRSY